MGIVAYLRRIRAGALLIAAVAAAVSKEVIKIQMVPEQLLWLADAGVLTAMASLVVTPLATTVQPARLIKRIAPPMFLALCAIVVIRATWVEEVTIGNTEYRLLVGTTLTDIGKTMEHNCLQGTKTENLPKLPRHNLILCAGPASIPAMYGSSYVILIVVYVISYLGFLGMFVLMVGSFEREGTPVQPAVDVRRL